MNLYLQKTDKTAALCGIIWFVTIIDACFLWLIPTVVLLLVGTLLVICATILLSQNHSLIVTNQRLKLFLLFFSFFSFILFAHASFKLFIGSILKFTPFFCLIFWPRKVLVKLYVYLKNFVVFYAVVSIIVELLVLSGLWKELPYYVLPAHDNVQELSGIVNYFYGLFVIPSRGTDVIFYRAMGPLREGGHFSIFLGFIYFVEKTVFDKRNVWVVIAGFLSLSPNFLFFYIVTEGYVLIKQKHLMGPLIAILCTIIIIGGVFWLFPDFIKGEIYRIVLERSLENNLMNASTNGYMELFDGRTNYVGLQMWNRFININLYSKLFGMGASGIMDSYVLSDFRILLIRYGYVGLFLILICSVRISFLGKNFIYGFCVLLLCIWVLLSRAWMFNSFYIWTMMLLSVNVGVVQGLFTHTKKYSE